MQIVIDIPDEVFKEAKKCGYSHIHDEEVAVAVSHGIPVEEFLAEFIDWYDLPFNNHFMKSESEIINDFLKPKEKGPVIDPPTSKQLNYIQSLEDKRKDVPPFKGTTKQEAWEFINKYKDNPFDYPQFDPEEDYIDYYYQDIYK